MPIDFYADNCMPLILLVLIFLLNQIVKFSRKVAIFYRPFASAMLWAHDDDGDSQHILKSLLLCSLAQSEKSDQEAECFACIISCNPRGHPIRKVIIPVTRTRTLRLNGLISCGKSHGQVEKSIQMSEFLKPAFLTPRTHLFFVSAFLTQDIIISFQAH